MEKINNKWIDENNNSWNCFFYTEERAIELSKTLSNCSDCRNCSDCSDCSNCIGCSDCSNCSNCIYCSDCSNCRGCSDCSKIKENPERYFSKKIGSRNDNTQFYFYDSKIWVVCGCFEGFIDEFECKVEDTYKKDEKHYIDYMMFLKKVKNIFLED